MYHNRSRFHVFKPDLDAGFFLRLRRQGICGVRGLQVCLLPCIIIGLIFGIWSALQSQQIASKTKDATTRESLIAEVNREYQDQPPAGAAEESPDAPIKGPQGEIEYGYNRGLHDEHCNAWRDDKINVHLVPHSHDDVGWLKTVDQYYWGDRMYTQIAGVQYTIDGTLSELARRADRRFVIVEMAFLWRWWRRADEASRSLFRKLLKRGQIELICAGWSMADEATTDYISLVDQHTTGFAFIQQEIDPNYRPLIAWQIDPFGHSREVASLFAEMGMNGFFFARLDYQERDQRQRNRTSEMVWQLRPNSPDLGLSMFTSFFARSDYQYPVGFNFEQNRDPPIMDDLELDGYNADARVQAFEKHMAVQRQQFPSNHMFICMGMDFGYMNPVPWFVNMDNLIKAFNRLSKGYHMLYSTPSCYTKAVYESTKALTNKSDDFFPYADKSQAYWTGYFTSRPSLKKITRDVSSIFSALRQLLTFSSEPLSDDARKKIMYMRDAQGILQHHDAVTGTAKQHVTDDYRKRASTAISYGNQLIALKLKEFHCGPGDCELKEVNFCRLLNESFCPFSEKHNSFSVIIYNPLAEARTEWVRIPVHWSDQGVSDPSGNPVTADVVPILNATASIPTRSTSTANYELVFKASLPPLGSAVYFIADLSNERKGKVAATSNFPPEKEYNEGSVKVSGKTIENGKIKLQLDDSGRFSALENIDDQVKIEFGHHLAYYVARGRPSPPSGAYLFTPNGSAIVFTEKPETQLIIGQQVVEIHHRYAFWAKSITRIYADASDVEVQWIVGPIPNLDYPREKIVEIDAVHPPTTTTTTTTTKTPPPPGFRPPYIFNRNVGPGPIGREVVSVYTSNIDSGSQFYTDANGREMLQRTKDVRPSWKLQGTQNISQNYYPLNSRISMKDNNAQLTVVIDRAEGGTGMISGTLEVMVHRRLTQDDSLGVGELLQEVEAGTPLVATGRHWVFLNGPSKAAQTYRKFSQKVFFPPVVTFTTCGDGSHEKWVGMGLKTTVSRGISDSPADDLLPPNVHLMTLERDFMGCQVFIRLEHIFEGDEDPTLAKPQRVELSKFVEKLLGHGRSFQIKELSLGGNMPVKDLVRLKWDTTPVGPGPFKETEPLANKPDEAKPLVYDKLGERMREAADSTRWEWILLQPMQIRTFCLNTSK